MINTYVQYKKVYLNSIPVVCKFRELFYAVGGGGAGGVGYRGSGSGQNGRIRLRNTDSNVLFDLSMQSINVWVWTLLFCLTIRDGAA